MQPVRGTKDLPPHEFEKFLFIQQAARKVFARYGFNEMDVPIFEFTELFKRSLGDDSDIVFKEMYTFEDRSGKSITLRPELTAGIARAVTTGVNNISLPASLFTIGPVFRYERPQKCRQRQFHQINCEAVGIKDPYLDAEVVAMAANFLYDLGIGSAINLEINSIGDKQTRVDYVKVLKEYLLKNFDNLSEDSKRRLNTNILRILDSKDETDREILRDAPSIENFFTKETELFFEKFCHGLKSMNIKYSINHSLVRGLDYYCHTVFEFTTKELGAQGTVIGGGRYDDLYSLIASLDAPAIGFAGGVERIADLLNYKKEKDIDIGIIVIGDFMHHACKVAMDLRNLGLTVSFVYQGKDLIKKMKKANSMKSKFVLIFGEDEMKIGGITFKNMLTGKQQQILLNNIIESVPKIIEEI